MRYTTENPRKKTELCEKWEWNLRHTGRGYCPYGRKCDFAHGIHELRARKQKPLPPRIVHIHVHLEHITQAISSELYRKHGARQFTKSHELVVGIVWKKDGAELLVLESMDERDRLNLIKAVREPLETICN